MTSSAAPARAVIAGHVTAAITEVLPTLDPDDVSGEGSLRDLGADSVDRVEIILAVLGRLGVDEPLSSFSDLPNVDAMIDFLYERSSR